MLANKDAVATVAVKDLKAAKKFYGDTLGLKPDTGSRAGSAQLQERQFHRARL